MSKLNEETSRSHQSDEKKTIRGLDEFLEQEGGRKHISKVNKMSDTASVMSDTASVVSDTSTVAMLAQDPLFMVLSHFLMHQDTGDNFVTALSKINDNLEKLNSSIEKLIISKSSS